MNKKTFFIIGCPRSGTTALAKILNTAINAEVFIEQEPKLCIAGRINYEFNMPLVREFIKKSKENKIKETHQKGLIYGDKNPNYLFFVDELIKNFDCRFIFMFRDGRDTVRSMMGWDLQGKTIYGRFEDDDESKIAQPEEDFWDFTRIRPKQDEELHKTWKILTKFEKISWYWNKFNDLILKKAKQLEKDRYLLLDITNADVGKIKEVFGFLGLEGLEEEEVAKMLTDKINSAKGTEKDRYPSWQSWNDNQKEKFIKFADPMMKKLGYYKNESFVN